MLAIHPPLIILCLLTTPLLATQFQRPALNNICLTIPETEELIQTISQQNKPNNLDQLEHIKLTERLEHAKKFVQDLNSSLKPKGRGSYGMVFIFKVIEVRKSLFLRFDDNADRGGFDKNNPSNFLLSGDTRLENDLYMNEIDFDTSEIMQRSKDMGMIIMEQPSNSKQEIHTLGIQKEHSVDIYNAQIGDPNLNSIVQSQINLKQFISPVEEIQDNHSFGKSYIMTRRQAVPNKEIFFQSNLNKQLFADEMDSPKQMSFNEFPSTLTENSNAMLFGTEDNIPNSPTFAKSDQILEELPEFGITVINEDPLEDFLERKEAPRAMKLLRIGNEMRIDHLKQQDSLIQEIEVMTTLKNDVTDYDFYFPEFYACSDLSLQVKQFVKSVDEDQYGEDLVEALRVPKNQIMVALELEKLSFNMVEYLSGVANGLIGQFDVPTRIMMARNLANALFHLSKKFIHCDIKPENIMFKLIDAESLQKLIDQDYPLLENDQHQIMLAKIIDFGISKPNTDANCAAGTPGYISPEYFTDQNHLKFDVFSLGVTLIDFELGMHQLPTLSNILAKIFMAKSNKQYRNTVLFKQLAKDDLFKKLIVMTANDSFKTPLITNLHNRKIWAPYKDKDIDFQKILKFDMNVLEFTILAAVGNLLKGEIYDLIETQRNIVDNNIKEVVSKLIKRATSLKSSNQRTQLNQDISFYSAHFALSFWAEKSVNKYFNIILSMVEWEADRRPNAATASQNLVQLYEGYLDSSKHERRFLENYDSADAISDIESSVISSMLEKNSSNVHFTEMRGTVMNDYKNSVISPPDYQMIFEKENSGAIKFRRMVL